MRTVSRDNLSKALKEVFPGKLNFESKAIQNIAAQIYKYFQIQEGIEAEQQVQALQDALKNFQDSLLIDPEWRNSIDKKTAGAKENEILLKIDILAALEEKYHVANMDSKALIKLTNDLAKISPNYYKTVIDNFLIVEQGVVKFSKINQDALSTDKGKEFVKDIADGKYNNKMIAALMNKGLDLKQITELKVLPVLINAQDAISKDPEWQSLISNDKLNEIQLRIDVLAALEGKYQVANMDSKALIKLTNDLVKISPQYYKIVIDNFLTVEKGVVQLSAINYKALSSDKGQRFIEGVAKGSHDSKVVDKLHATGLNVEQIIEFYQPVFDKIKDSDTNPELGAYIKHIELDKVEAIIRPYLLDAEKMGRFGATKFVESLIREIKQGADKVGDIIEPYFDGEMLSTREGSKFIQKLLESINFTDADKTVSVMNFYSINSKMLSTPEGSQFAKNHLENLKLTDAINNAISAKSGTNENRGGANNPNFVKLSNDFFEIISPQMHQGLDKYDYKNIKPIVDTFVRKQPLGLLTSNTKKILTSPTGATFVKNCLQEPDLALGIHKELSKFNLPPFDDYINLHNEMLKVAKEKGLLHEDLNFVSDILAKNKNSMHVNYAIARLQNLEITHIVDEKLKLHSKTDTPIDKGIALTSYIKVSKQLIDYINTLPNRKDTPKENIKIAEILVNELIIGSDKNIHIDPRTLHLYSTEVGQKYVNTRASLSKKDVAEIDHLLRSYKLSNEKRIQLFSLIAEKDIYKDKEAIQKVLEESEKKYFIFTRFDFDKAIKGIEAMPSISSVSKDAAPSNIPNSLSVAQPGLAPNIPPPPTTLPPPLPPTQFPSIQPSTQPISSDSKSVENSPSVNVESNLQIDSQEKALALNTSPALNAPVPPSMPTKPLVTPNQGQVVNGPNKAKGNDLPPQTNLLDQINAGIKLKKAKPSVPQEQNATGQEKNDLASTLQGAMSNYRADIDDNEDSKTVKEISHLQGKLKVVEYFESGYFDDEQDKRALLSTIEQTITQNQATNKLTRPQIESLKYAKEWLQEQLDMNKERS